MLFGSRYFAPRYFGPRYWGTGEPTGAGVEYQYEIKPFGSLDWELLQDWTAVALIFAPGYPVGVTAYRVRARDAANHADVSDWVEVEVDRLGEVPTLLVPPFSVDVDMEDGAFASIGAAAESWAASINAPARPSASVGFGGRRSATVGVRSQPSVTVGIEE